MATAFNSDAMTRRSIFAYLHGCKKMTARASTDHGVRAFTVRHETLLIENEGVTQLISKLIRMVPKLFLYFSPISSICNILCCLVFNIYIYIYIYIYI
uniref:Uncharacterized protein n=1 Tax=Oryza glumipatula TaxID=40148 RepID=A0A0D9ZCI7_9ORYZ